jgi:hypothetical protein
MPEFILKLEEKNKKSLGAVRCMAGLQAAQDGAFMWIKGINALTDIDTVLKQLPVKNTFLLDEDDNLFFPGALTPADRLKALNWQPLIEFIGIELPVTALPGKAVGAVNLKLIKSSKERKGNALLTALDTWKQYAETAPESRLLTIKFAVSEQANALIIGDPLPPVPGREYWETNNILIPAGYDFEFSIMVSFIQKKLNADKSSVILFDIDGSWQKIDKSFFVAGKRSAVRLTKVNND